MAPTVYSVPYSGLPALDLLLLLWSMEPPPLAVAAAVEALPVAAVAEVPPVVVVGPPPLVAVVAG